MRQPDVSIHNSSENVHLPVKSKTKNEGVSRLAGDEISKYKVEKGLTLDPKEREYRRKSRPCEAVCRQCARRIYRIRVDEEGKNPRVDKNRPVVCNNCNVSWGPANSCHRAVSPHPL